MVVRWMGGAGAARSAVLVMGAALLAACATVPLPETQARAAATRQVSTLRYPLVDVRAVVDDVIARHELEVVARDVGEEVEVIRARAGAGLFLTFELRAWAPVWTHVRMEADEGDAGHFVSRLISEIGRGAAEQAEAREEAAAGDG